VKRNGCSEILLDYQVTLPDGSKYSLIDELHKPPELLFDSEMTD